MQITNRFTIAVHIITAIDYFCEREKVTSSFLADSVGANPVIVREIMRSLKNAAIIEIRQGKSGIKLARRLEGISFYDVYKALNPVKDNELFHFHENPNPDCPVGRNIHEALSRKLDEVQEKFENSLKEIRMIDVSEDIKNTVKGEI